MNVSLLLDLERFPAPAWIEYLLPATHNKKPPSMVPRGAIFSLTLRAKAHAAEDKDAGSLRCHSLIDAG
jgi:hypothetical protein